MLDLKQKSKEMIDSIDKEMDNLRKEMSSKLGLDTKRKCLEGYKNGKTKIL